MTRLVIIGSGGHAKVLADMARLSDIELAGFIDRGGSPSGLSPVLGNDDWLVTHAKAEEITHFIIGMGSVKGGAGLRETLFNRHSAYLTPFTLIHPSAILAEEVSIGAGSAVMAGAILNPGVKLGENTVVNTGAVLDHDVLISNHAHIAPGCTLSGSVVVGPFSLIGTGSAVRQGAKIGAGVTLGAGSVVVSDMADGVTAFGNPARARG